MWKTNKKKFEIMYNKKIIIYIVIKFVNKINKNPLVYFSISMFVLFVTQFYKYVVLNDFYVYIQTDCNPNNENCFLNNSGDPEDNMEVYKKMYVKNYLIQNCSDSNKCVINECNNNDDDCIILNCSKMIAKSDERCTDKIQV